MKSMLLLLVLLLPCGGVVLATEITLDSAARERLGVRTVAPSVAQHSGSIAVQARVEVPPQADRLIGVFEEGVVSRLKVGPGDRVSAGDPVAEVSSPVFLSAQSEYLAAVGAAQVHRTQFKRDQSLEAEGIISRRRLEESAVRASTAEADLARYRQRLLLAGLTEAELDALTVKQKLSAVLEIRAPADGVVLAQLAGIGDPVGPLAPIYRIADLSTLTLELQVRWEQIDSLRPGLPVVVALPDGERVLAEVYSTGALVDTSTQKAAVLARTTTADHGLLPGQTFAARILLPMDEAPGSHWQVPGAALTRHGEGTHLFVETAAGFEVRAVRIIGHAGEAVLVEGDLTSTDQVAIAGLATLKSLWLGQAEGP